MKCSSSQNYFLAQPGRSLLFGYAIGLLRKNRKKRFRRTSYGARTNSKDAHPTFKKFASTIEDEIERTDFSKLFIQPKLIKFEKDSAGRNIVLGEGNFGRALLATIFDYMVCVKECKGALLKLLIRVSPFGAYLVPVADRQGHSN